MVSISLFGRVIKARTQCQFLLASILVLFLAILVPLLAIENNKASDRKSNTIKTGLIPPINSPGNFSGLIVMANITSIDTKDFTTGVRFIFLTAGDYDTKRTDVEQLSVSLNFTTLGGKTVIDTLELNPTRQFSYYILDGNPNYYPFDEYYSDFFVSAQIANGTRVPLAFGIVDNVMGWTVSSEVFDLPLSSIGVGMSLKRNWITKFFSLFVVLIMWTLSLTVLTLATTIWFRDRKVEASTISVCSGLLFALPAIRNAQSGAPPLGCTADVGSFFWCMPLTAFSTFILMINYIVSYKREKVKAQ